MPMFRKKPIVIEAIQYNASPPNCAEICAWADIEHLPDDQCGCVPITISTLEGDMEAQPGDWVIKGVKGEFYPCKPDIFAATYEPA